MSGQPAFPVDPTRHRWIDVRTELRGGIPVGYAYSILGHDMATGRLDLLFRWRGDGGHCPIHRHVAPTSVLVLEGEQHLWDVLPGGVRGPERVRRAGEYAFTGADGVPHLERGGAEGGLVFFGNLAPDGRLYEIFDEALNLVSAVTVASMVAGWEGRP